VTFYEQATSHITIMACNIHNICFTKANAIIHPGLVLHFIEDGLGNNANGSKIGMK
jgi:hypothetical protein